MPTAPENLAKAKLQAFKWKGTSEVSLGHSVEVQFNPETITLSFNTQKSGGDQRGGAALQFSGVATSKLSMDLWFDITAFDQTQGQNLKDVRQLTEKVVYFITPNDKMKDDKNPQPVPPAIKLTWGKFTYKGMLDSLNQKFDYFSEDGRPLRAMLSIGITGMLVELKPESNPTGNGLNGIPGTKPLQAAKGGESVSQMVGNVGQANDWKKYAAANNIENTRNMLANTLVDTNPQKLNEAYNRLKAGE